MNDIVVQVLHEFAAHPDITFHAVLCLHTGTVIWVQRYPDISSVDALSVGVKHIGNRKSCQLFAAHAGLQGASNHHAVVRVLNRREQRFDLVLGQEFDESPVLAQA